MHDLKIGTVLVCTNVKLFIRNCEFLSLTGNLSKFLLTENDKWKITQFYDTFFIAKNEKEYHIVLSLCPHKRHYWKKYFKIYDDNKGEINLMIEFINRLNNIL